MKIKIVIEADIDMTEVKKNPVIRIQKQLRSLETTAQPLPVTTTLMNNDGIIQVHPTPPSDGILKF